MIPQPSTPCLCPECGSPVDLDERARIGTLTWVPTPGAMPRLEEGSRPAVVGFCSGCDFAVEVLA